MYNSMISSKISTDIYMNEHIYDINIDMLLMIIKEMKQKGGECVTIGLKFEYHNYENDSDYILNSKVIGIGDNIGNNYFLTEYKDA